MSEYVNVNGTSLHCRIDGPSTDAPWIVCCNSLLTNFHLWDQQVARFSGTYNILRYDQRGHGKSRPPDHPVTFDILGNDLIALMQHFGIARATFVGISMGTPTGLDIWSKRPDLIERLVLCDGQARPTPEGSKLWDERLAIAKSIGWNAYIDDTLKRWFSPEFFETMPDQAAGMREMMLKTSFAGFENCIRALQNFDYYSVLPTISCPVLLMVGSNDGGLPAVMLNMKAQIPSARLEVIPDAGHISNVEQHDAFSSALADFFDASP